MAHGHGCVLFHSLKGEVVALRHELVAISEHNSRLVHKQECHNSVSRVHDRLDEFDAQNKSIGERLTRIEASHEACSRCGHD